MNKKFFKTFAVAVILIFLFTISASAWMPEKSFYCNIESENIPDGTAYIDLLLPIKEKDECYVEYNAKNGEKFNISKDSEIVKYNQDGYKSYTFHVLDADSKMSLRYVFTFTALDEDYEMYKEYLEFFSPYCDKYAFGRNYCIDTEYDGDIMQNIQILKDKTNINIYSSRIYTEYNEGYERETEYDFDYMRIKYKYAKMAYLDADGNILGVSNKVRINQHKRTGVHLDLNLSGLELTEDASTGPPVYLIFVIPMVLLFFFVCGIIIGITIFIIERKKRKK